MRAFVTAVRPPVTAVRPPLSYYSLGTPELNGLFALYSNVLLTLYARAICYKLVTSKISKSVCVMRSLYCQLPADVMVKLYYSLVCSHLTYALLEWGRSGGINAAKIECAHRRACKFLNRL